LKHLIFNKRSKNEKNIRHNSIIPIYKNELNYLRIKNNNKKY